MALDVKVPPVGESVQEAMIHKWRKAAGDFVKRDEVLMDLETDKATVEVTAEAEGVLEVLRNEGDTVAIGEVIARIDTNAKGAAKPAADKSATPPPPPAAKAAAPAAAAAAAPAATAPASDAPTMPAARRLATESNVNLGDVSGTGKGGRVTKGDVITHLEGGSAPATAKAPDKPAVKAPEVRMPVVKSGGGSRGERREPMSMLRRRVAERLIHAQTTAAILTTFNEVDMTNVMNLRKQYKDSFKEKHGVGLGFMSFFVKAAIEALHQFPQINGWIEGNEIVFHEYYDISVAVSGEKGLVVPVVRNADQMSMAQIEMAIAYLGTQAKANKLTVDELTGGTFTISNGGTFGSLLSTPILNPPQSAILGMHKIQDRPVVVNGQVVVRPMMYLALSYDHRIVDGREAVQFLVKIKDCIEDPTRLLLSV